MAGLIQMLPYLDESTPPSQRNVRSIKSFIMIGVATVSIDQNVIMGRFTSLGVFVFDTTARVELDGYVYNSANAVCRAINCDLRDCYERRESARGECVC